MAAGGLFVSGLMMAGEVEVLAVKPESVVEKEGVRIVLQGEARLGLGVSKPDDFLSTQLPALPPGIGFVVSELEDGGPADVAGIRKLDLLWKLNEQMLVNEGQLAILLRLSSPGDKVTASVFREGKQLDLMVVLGEGKGDGGESLRRALAETVMRPEDGALRIVNLEERKAVVSKEGGRAEVMRAGSGDAVRIFNKEGGVIFEGVVRGGPEATGVPAEWRKEVCAMRRGLDHALSAKAAPERKPRPRIVPPPVKITGAD